MHTAFSSWLQRITTATSYSALAVAIMIGLFSLLHFKLSAVQSNSMTPTFQKGDALFIRPIRPQQIRLGDIVVYRRSTEPTIPVSHRVVSVGRHGYIVTAGDRQYTPDEPVSVQQVTGRAVAVAPHLGTYLDLMRTPKGLIIMVYIPASSIISMELYRLTRSNRRPAYQLHDAHSA